MPMTGQDLQRRLAELEAAGQAQVRANQPRDLSGLDMRAMQAQQSLRTPTAAFPPVPQGVPTAAFPPVPQGMPPGMPSPGMPPGGRPMIPPRDLAALQMPQRTAVRGY